MKSTIHRDLEKTERRESQLWFLTLGLLVLFGAVFAVLNPLNVLMSEESTGVALRLPTRNTLVMLFGLVLLFSLYVLNTMLLNRRLRRLLTEMESLAASSLEPDSFLPSIAAKIAGAGMARSCQIVLLSEQRQKLSVRAASAAGTDWTGQIGKAQYLGDLTICRKAIETREPVLLSRAEVAALWPEDRDLLVGDSLDPSAVLVLPLIAENRVLGLIALGRKSGLVTHRFGTPTITLACTLTRHAATAIDQAQLKRQAIHDPLTNLYNRRHLSERLQHELAKAGRSDGVVAVLLCDLDRFKAVNDTRGHQVGDELLKAVAQSVKAATRNSDLVFRWGGDEIVVILAESTREGVLTAAHRIRSGVLRTAEEAELDIDVSIGIARFPEHGKTEDELIKTADRALYIAKKSGDNVRIGEEDYHLDRSSITVVFQPVVDVTSGRPIGYEALTRDPGGKLSVAELFDKYRAIGRLKELKEITLRSQIEVAHEMGMGRVFINADFSVLGQMEPLPKPPGMDVVIELSELEALTDLDNHLSVACRWREAGYQFALDDFGAGFISFPFLATLVPEYIKVDRSTMLQAVTSDKFRGFLTSLLDAVSGYATAGIIAEGVEQEEELAMVKAMGVNLVQGYYYGKPQELDRSMLELPEAALAT